MLLFDSTFVSKNPTDSYLALACFIERPSKFIDAYTRQAISSNTKPAKFQ